MTRYEVITSLLAGGYYHGSWPLDDMAYDAMSKFFVEQAFSDWVASLPPELRAKRTLTNGHEIDIPLWVEEVFDCDNQVRSFGSFVADAFALDAVKKKLKRGNAASGKFNFLLKGEPDGGHARFWFVDYAGTAHSFDPGIGEFTVESPIEKESIMGGETI